MANRIEVGGSNYEMGGRIEVGCSNWISTSSYSSRNVVSAPNESRVGRVSPGDPGNPGIYRDVVKTPIETNMGRVVSEDSDWSFFSFSNGICEIFHSFFSKDSTPGKIEGAERKKTFHYQTVNDEPKAVLVRYEREPDREVDNDVSQRCREACGDYSRDSHRDRESSLFGKREWTDTARDAADVTQKLWEASQMAKTGTGGMIAGGIKCYEAAEPAARVIEDLGKDAAERFVESRSDSVKGGYSEYSDIGFQ